MVLEGGAAMASRYKIGEFSRLTELSVKTLRYYHELHLLEPSVVDEETGYRYYDGRGYERARQIRLLKDLGFTLGEIAEIADRIGDAGDLQAYLREKHQQLEHEAAAIRKAQEKLMRMIEQKEERRMYKTSAMTVKTLPPQMAACVRYKGRYDQMGEHAGALYKAVKGAAAGPLTAVYHDDCYMEEGADIEVCLPVKKEVAAGGIGTQTLAGGRFASVVHTGPYDTISESYKALMDAVQAAGLEAAGPSREVYVKGPGLLLKGNPDKYETELLMPVKD